MRRRRGGADPGGQGRLAERRLSSVPDGPKPFAASSPSARDSLRSRCSAGAPTPRFWAGVAPARWQRVVDAARVSRRARAWAATSPRVSPFASPRQPARCAVTRDATGDCARWQAREWYAIWALLHRCVISDTHVYFDRKPRGTAACRHIRPHGVTSGRSRSSRHAARQDRAGDRRPRQQRQGTVGSAIRRSRWYTICRRLDLLLHDLKSDLIRPLRLLRRDQRSLAPGSHTQDAVAEERRWRQMKCLRRRRSRSSSA